MGGRRARLRGRADDLRRRGAGCDATADGAGHARLAAASLDLQVDLDETLLRLGVAAFTEATGATARTALDVERLTQRPLLALAALTVDVWHLGASAAPALLARVEELLLLRGKAGAEALAATVAWTADPALLDLDGPRRYIEVVAATTTVAGLAELERPTRCLLLDLHLRAAVALGALETAQELLETIESLAADGDEQCAAFAGCAAALVALACDRPVNADALATTAAELARRAPSPLLEARAAVLAGRAQAELGAADVACERFAEGERLARTLHAEPLAREASRLRATLDRAVTAGGPAASGPVGTLTRRQLEIARLAAAGRTNREVAAALGISEHTVNAHLRAAFRRLGVTRRRALSRVLERDERSS